MAARSKPPSLLPLLARGGLNLLLPSMRKARGYNNAFSAPLPLWAGAWWAWHDASRTAWTTPTALCARRRIRAVKRYHRHPAPPTSTYLSVWYEHCAPLFPRGPFALPWNGVFYPRAGCPPNARTRSPSRLSVKARVARLSHGAACLAASNAAPFERAPQQTTCSPHYTIPPCITVDVTTAHICALHAKAAAMTTAGSTAYTAFYRQPLPFLQPGSARPQATTLRCALRAHLRGAALALPLRQQTRPAHRSGHAPERCTHRAWRHIAVQRLHYYSHLHARCTIPCACRAYLGSAPLSARLTRAHTYAPPFAARRHRACLHSFAPPACVPCLSHRIATPTAGAPVFARLPPSTAQHQACRLSRYASSSPHALPLPRACLLYCAPPHAFGTGRISHLRSTNACRFSCAGRFPYQAAFCFWRAGLGGEAAATSLHLAASPLPTPQPRLCVPRLSPLHFVCARTPHRDTAGSGRAAVVLTRTRTRRTIRWLRYLTAPHFSLRAVVRSRTLRNSLRAAALSV